VGPDRPDDSRTLVLVTDDDFSATQATQFVALALFTHPAGSAGIPFPKR
jgi:hypothetical protein